MDSHERRSKDVNEAATEVIGSGQLGLSTPQGFEDLYRNTFPRVYAYVASLLRDRSAAEDVTALAFERAYRKRSRFSARRGSPEAWVFGIARNAALDELRKLKRRARLETEPADVWSPGPDEEAERAFRRDEVRAALAKAAREAEIASAMGQLGDLLARKDVDGAAAALAAAVERFGDLTQFAGPRRDLDALRQRLAKEEEARRARLAKEEEARQARLAKEEEARQAAARRQRAAQLLTEAAARAGRGDLAGAIALANSLREHRTEALLYRRLATLRTDVPLTQRVDDLRWAGARRGLLTALCREIGDEGFVERVPRWRDDGGA